MGGKHSREYNRTYMRRYRRKHLKKMRAYDRARYTKKDYGKKRARRYRAANPERHKAALRRSFQKHKKKRMAEAQAWRRANKEAWSLYMRAVKARRRAAEGRYTRTDIRRLFSDQEGACKACDVDLTNGYHIDHIVPVVRGGSNWPSNLQLLCGSCNRSKGAKTMTEWLAA